MDRRDGLRFAQAKRPKLSRHGQALLRRLAFIHAQEHRALLLAQPSGNGFISGRKPLLAIDNHQGHAGFGHRQAGLLANFRQELAVVIEHQATGVHHTKGAATPEPLLIGAIAGDTRLVMDDCVATAAQTIHQGGLAHVGPPDDGHHRQGHGCVPLVFTLLKPYRPAPSRL